jgi:hypothetical protein
MENHSQKLNVAIDKAKKRLRTMTNSKRLLHFVHEWATDDKSMIMAGCISRGKWFTVSQSL